MISFEELFQQIETALPAERHAFRKRLRSMERAVKSKKPFDRNLTRWRRDLEQSAKTLQIRQQAVPTITYVDDLPIHQRISEIQQTIRDNPVTIICGETGSGKSTQLPKICLEMGRGIEAAIGHTQPRRIAARSVASRVAEELKVPLGKQVGFKIRFTDATDPSTLIKLMTDGILLAEIQGDSFLNAYDTIIIDEAHERSLNIDLLLGYLKTLLPKRPDLRVIVTSATIDVQRYADFFATNDTPAPILTVEGRSYPVEVRYRSPEQPNDEERDADPLQNLLETLDDVCSEGFGDSLVFAPTERDIREIAKHLQSRNLPGDHAGRQTEILPLYGRLSAADQARVFQPHPHRRIVIATNVAESSITVPNIRYVIDTGTARISRYSSRSGVQRLPIEPISQASANQRMGRCGRIGPGICIRLYSEEDFETREAFTPPEIQRTNLASVILQLKVLGLGNIEAFPFLDPPKPATIRDGYNTLFELGAIDEQQQVTEIGHTLAKLPVDPRVGRMILAGQSERCLHEVLIIASALELQDPRERPLEHQQAADQSHQSFQSTDSDFIAFLKLWSFIKTQQKNLSRAKFRRLCQKRFLSYNRVREWIDIHRQLVQLTQQAGFDPHQSVGIDVLIEADEPNSDQTLQHPHDLRPRDNRRAPREAYDALHRALMVGLLSNIAQKKDGKTEFEGCGGQTLFIWPGSGLIERKPKWLVAAELVETTRRYARCVARIQPNWIEALAPHLVKHHYGEPFWDPASARVMADERVTLFGLTIVPRRNANYGPRDPATARTLFIQHALIEDEWESPPAIQRENQTLRKDVEAFLAKTRRLDLLKGETEQFTFFDRALPDDVFDGPTLSRWLKTAGAAAIDQLRLRKSDLIQNEADSIEEGDFPGEIQIGSTRLPLEYHLEPGAADDGVTLLVPQMALSQLSQDRLSWLVPGLLEDKVSALIRSLPKSIRTAFVPVPQTAKEIVKELAFGKGRLETVLAERLSRMAGEHVTAEHFDVDRLPPHLRMNVRILSDSGDVIETGRDVATLRKTHATQGAHHALRQPAGTNDWHCDGFEDWTWDELPEAITITRDTISFAAFPAIVDQEQAVGLRLFDSREQAESESWRGLRRLFLLKNHKAVRTQVEWLPNLDRHLLNLATWQSPAVARHQLQDRIADRSLQRAASTLPRCPADYHHLIKGARNQIRIAAQDVHEVLVGLSEGWQATQLILEQKHPEMWGPAIDDIRSQVGQLGDPEMLLTTPWEWFVQFPRYFTAIQARYQKLSAGGLDRDRKIMNTISPYWTAYRQRLDALDGRPPGQKLVRFHFMIEEFRVSQFAQKLGTSITISENRLDKALAKIQ